MLLVTKAERCMPICEYYSRIKFAAVNNRAAVSVAILSFKCGAVFFAMRTLQINLFFLNIYCKNAKYTFYTLNQLFLSFHPNIIIKPKRKRERDTGWFIFITRYVRASYDS